MAVSEEAVRGLAFIEQVYWETGELPSTEKIVEEIGVVPETVKNWFKSENFRTALLKRGVSLRVMEDNPNLTFDQLTVVSMLLNTLDKRSQREKLEEAGVTTQQLQGWMRDPKFVQYLKTRTEQMFAGADSAAYMSILRGMENGDLRATQLFLEMRGIYNPKIVHEINIDGILARVVEIISIHVKDPVTLSKIADDLERLEGVGQPATQALPQALEVKEVPEGF